MLAADHVHSSLRDLCRRALDICPCHNCWRDFQQLLRDALDLLRKSWASRRPQRPIALGSAVHYPHWQNRVSVDWVSLIELPAIRGWLRAANDSARATRIAPGLVLSCRIPPSNAWPCLPPATTTVSRNSGWIGYW